MDNSFPLPITESEKMEGTHVQKSPNAKGLTECGRNWSTTHPRNTYKHTCAHTRLKGIGYKAYRKKSQSLTTTTIAQWNSTSNICVFTLCMHSARKHEHTRNIHTHQYIEHLEVAARCVRVHSVYKWLKWKKNFFIEFYSLSKNWYGKYASLETIHDETWHSYRHKHPDNLVYIVILLESQPAGQLVSLKRSNLKRPFELSLNSSISYCSFFCTKNSFPVSIFAEKFNSNWLGVSTHFTIQL